MTVARSLIAAVCFTLAAEAFAFVHVAAGQDVFQMYLNQQKRERASSWDSTRLQPRPLDVLHASKSLARTYRVEDSSNTEGRSDRLGVYRWLRIPKYARNWFLERYGDVDWAFAGSYRITQLDTMRTSDLRARLQAQFGSPTQTLADFGPLHRLDLEEYIQFEYWFVVNDTIPMIVMDVNGPFERGVVVSSDIRYRHVLMDLRDALMHRVASESIRQPFVDYYFEEELGEWFVTGFDGAQFFVRSIDPRRVLPGRPAPG